MKILGLQKLTLLDYPGKVGAVIFLGGCNFRCPFCQNGPLVLKPEAQSTVDREEFRHFLKKRASILDGICVTGGEPTLHADLPELLAEIHAYGYLVKLDTNGTNPDMLGRLITDGLIDYAAIDIKAGRKNYGRVCGLEGSTAASSVLARVSRSVQILMEGKIDYEFRTTVVRGLHTEEDFLDIAKWISGCSHYYLQAFRDSEGVIAQGHSFSEFSKEEMKCFLAIVQRTIPGAELRGI